MLICLTNIYRIFNFIIHCLLLFSDITTKSYIGFFLLFIYIHIVKNILWCHSYVSHEFIKINKSVFTNKNKIKFSCPVSLTKNVTKTNTKIQINNGYPK
jgi:hypothetical protein